MKNDFVLLFAVLLILLSGCEKEKNPPVSAPDTMSDTVPYASGSGSDGSGSGSGGDGSTTTTGLLRSFLSGTSSRLVSTKTDSMLVTFSQPAPAEGWTLNLSSSDPAAAQVPATHPVPPGATGVYFPVTGGQLVNAKLVTITVRLFAESKTNTIKVFPLTATFPAPQLKSPGDGANFKSRTIVTFEWNPHNNAYHNHLQISDNAAFTTPMTDLYLPDPLWRQSYFNGYGNRYWRARYVDASGNPGPWSQVRRFEVRPE